MEKTSYESMQDILHKVKEESLHISRIPRNTREKFIALANAEFVGDYGMTIKFLIDGLINPELNEMYSQINDLQQRVEILESNQNLPSQPEGEENVIKTMSGKEIKK